MSGSGQTAQYIRRKLYDLSWTENLFRATMQKRKNSFEKGEHVSIPMFAVMKNGKVVDTKVGAMPKTNLEAMLK